MKNSMTSLELAKERIMKDLCPLCGKFIAGHSVMVVDPNLGNIFICRHHLEGEKQNEM